MKKNNTHKVVFAWLLAVVFLIPIITKAVHILQNEYCEELCLHKHEHEDKEHTSRHDCSTCPVCQFTLSFFTGLEPVLPDTIFTVPCRREPVLYSKKGYFSTVQCIRLRAPPAQA